MKKILIYRDKGADLFCIASLLTALKLEKIDQKFCIDWADRELLQAGKWQKTAHLLIFPGGRDLPYHQALKGTANGHIREFVLNGGKFLGICAGGYYGSAMIEFEKGGPLEVLGARELKFFPGIARGPAYGLRKFCYKSHKGAQIAKLISIPRLAQKCEFGPTRKLSRFSCFSEGSIEYIQPSEKQLNPEALARSKFTLLGESGYNSSSTSAYYNGGCIFVEAEKYDGVSIIARYADIEGQPAAIVKCEVGAGKAILTGVHPEHSVYKEIELERRALFTGILNELLISQE